jgi:tetratricopeptide (TPR) repeat protein
LPLLLDGAQCVRCSSRRPLLQVVVEEVPEALKIKGEGNLHFKGGRYEQAIACYTRSLQALPRPDHPEAAKLFSNRAACASQMGDHAAVVADSGRSLEVTPAP